MTKPTLRSIEGTHDLLGKDATRFEQTMNTAARRFSAHGYQRIYTPTFENTDLFSRSIGETTDIVEKEMYTFTAGSHSLTLRPEGTAGVIRAYLQHNLHKQGGLTKLWYAGPMFRRERPQKGRQRQFHQVGVEAVGSADPLLDAEVIAMGLDLYQELGISGTRTRLNSIGCPAENCRPAYRRNLKAALEPRLPDLCKTCQNRYERNILRILDCKNETCRSIARDLPKSTDNLCDDCAEHFAAVRDALQSLGIDFQVDNSLVRGLDYYTKTVFEYTHADLGAQDAIGGGGRYDGLVEQLGGPSMPAIGFALGVERIMIAMQAGDASADQRRIQVYGLALGNDCRRRMAGLLREIRELGISADMDFEGRSFKAQMRAANRAGACLCIILGENELARGKAAIKDMRPNGEQIETELEQIVEHVQQQVNRNS